MLMSNIFMHQTFYANDVDIMVYDPSVKPSHGAVWGEIDELFYLLGGLHNVDCCLQTQ